jgi:hypothetical protein
MHLGFWIGLAMIGGYFLLFHVGVNRMLSEEKASSRSPFSEKLKRPPGESMRLELERLRDEIGEAALKLSLSAVGPAVLIMLLSIRPPELLWTVYGLIVILAVGAVARQWSKLLELRTKLRKTHLGYDGERYVGEELNGLMSRGYRVFHDFQVDWLPGERVFNIDHIAVGPEGVFAIETKARRKRNGDTSSPQRQHQVIYNGQTMKYPDWESDEQLRQAIGGAEILSQWLTGTAKSPVEVVPVLVIPGWWVERKGRGPVRVFSGKEIATNLPAHGLSKALGPDEIQRLGDRIEAHCRNVEGA